MRRLQVNSVCGRLAGAVMTLLALCCHQAEANDLVVCAGKNEMPFSNESKEGFENSIAQLIGVSLKRKISFYWWSNALTLGKELNEKKCDLMIGVDPDDPRVQTTKPYYKSAYVFITREDREIDIQSWNHEYLKQKNFRIGVLPDSPGKVMLLQINRFDDMFDYFTEIQNFQSTRNRYIRVEPARLVNDVVTQHLHAACLWAPEAARYVKSSSTPLKMTVIDDDAKKANGQKIPMHYKVAMGVRKGDDELLMALNQFIDENQAKIQEILNKEGIPLLSLND